MRELTISMAMQSISSYTASVAFASVMLALMSMVTVGYLAAAIVMSRRKASLQTGQGPAPSYLARTSNPPPGDAVDPVLVLEQARQRRLSSAYSTLGGGIGSLVGVVVVIPLFLALVAGDVAPFISSGMLILAPWLVCVFCGLGIATYALSKRLRRKAGSDSAQSAQSAQNERATRIDFAQQGGINVLIACGTIVAISVFTLGATLLFLPGGKSVSQGSSDAQSQTWLLWYMLICTALLVASVEVLASSTRRLMNVTNTLTPQASPMTLRWQLASLRWLRFFAANTVAVLLVTQAQLLPMRDTAAGYVLLGLYFAVLIASMAANFIVFIRIGGFRNKNDAFA